jgi:kynurenine formamidase
MSASRRAAVDSNGRIRSSLWDDEDGDVDVRQIAAEVGEPGVDADQLGDAYLERQPGVGLEAAIWLADRGIVALGADTAGTEPLPLVDVTRTVHAALLVERGIYLIENLWLEELAARECYESLFVCLPLRLRGATASWVRPVAFGTV